MTDIENGVVTVVASQWMPGLVPTGLPISGGGACTIAWMLWDGNVNVWTRSLQQTTSLSSGMVRAVGSVITTVAAGGAGSTVAAVGGADPKCVVSTATVNSRLNVTLQFQDSGTSANIGAACNLDVPLGYAAAVGACFTGMRCFGL